MLNYTLSALLKIRGYKKTAADNNFQEACFHHETEKIKLSKIENSLKASLVKRTTLQNDFFVKASNRPYNTGQVINHNLSSQKNVYEEKKMKKAITKQKEVVRSAALNLEIALSQALNARINLKIIEKHHSSWLQQLQRLEVTKEENNSDEQNDIKYVLTKNKAR